MHSWMHVQTIQALEQFKLIFSLLPLIVVTESLYCC